MRTSSIVALALSVSLAIAAAGCTKSSESPDLQAGGENAALSDGMVDGDALKQRLDDAIAFTKTRYLNADQNNAWQIVHGILAFGPELKMYANGELVSALDYFLAGGEVRGWNLRPGDRGLEAILEAGTKAGQGHEDQWLGYISQVGLPADQPIVVKGQTFKFIDLLTQAQWDIYPGMEATWTLMGASTYLPLDARWTAKNGEEWTIDRIVAQEAAEDLNESPCGGTHRMYGLALAMNHYLSQGNQPQGAWLDAEKKIQQAIADARRNQQPNGLFSTSYFARAGSSPDIAVQMSTSGHVFEFLAMAMSDEQLQEPWMTRAANALCELFEETRDMSVECASLYHAAHGLVLYRMRRFGPPETAGEPPAPTATAPAEPAPAPPSQASAADNAEKLAR